MKCDRCGHVSQDRARFCSACGSELAINLVGEVLSGRYRVLSFIGSGGMGRVYRAEHMYLEKPVAIKVLAPEYSRDEAMWRRFRREAFAASRVAHPHIAATLDFAYEVALVYSVMEYVDGTPLDMLIDHRPMPVHRALSIAQQIALALGAAHEAGVIHRDVKPGNVIVGEINRKDFVKVVDFGLAVLRSGLGKVRTTQGGVTMGTPAYVAPELVLGDPLDSRTDVYTLGAVLYEMLVGEPPFGHGDPAQLSVSHAYKTPKLPSEHGHVFRVPEEVDELVMAMLAKNPSHRPVDGNAVAEELARILSLLSSPVPMVSQKSCAVLAVRFGDLEAAMDQARREVVGAIYELGGNVARVPGDELVTYFDSATCALQAAARLRDLAIAWPLAAAVHHGPIELSASGGVFGQTVNVALRMVRQADIGEALATGEVRDALDAATPARLSEGTRMRLLDRSVEVFPVTGLANDDLPEIPGTIRGRSAVEFTCVCSSQGVIVTGRLREGEAIRARCRGCSRQLSVIPYGDEVVGAGLWDTMPDRLTPERLGSSPIPDELPATQASQGLSFPEPHVDDSPTENEIPRVDEAGAASQVSEAD